MSDDDWNEITATPAGPDTYGRFMRVRDFDCWMHEHDIRDAVRRPADDTELAGPASRLALDEMAASMGFVVGKLGGAPDGSRVAIELTGPLRRTINVDGGGPRPGRRELRRRGADGDDRARRPAVHPVGGRSDHRRGRTRTPSNMAATRLSAGGSSSTSTT